MTEFFDDQYWDNIPPVPVYPPIPFRPHAPIMMSHMGDNSGVGAVVISSVGEGPKGDTGDNLVFEDLTEDELASIYENVSFVSTTTKNGTYTTTADNETYIPWPIQDLDPDDILFITIDGIDLVEDVDYTRTLGGIVLNSPIEDAGTTVVFRALSYALPDGNKNIVINQVYDDIDRITNADIDRIMV